MAEPVTNVEGEGAASAKPSGSATVASPDFALRELLVFGSIVSAILLSANAVVCATWGYFFSISGWMEWQAFPGLLAIAFIPATVLRFRSSHPALRVIYAISAAWVGALNFAFFAAIGFWMVEGAVWLTGWPLARFPIATIFFGLALGATVYGLINARTIRVSRATVRLPNLPQAWHGRTVALVTDLHLGPLYEAGFLRRVIARLLMLKPDAVFISGDMFDGWTLGADQLIAPWREYSAPQGVYFVTGNHDEFVDRNIVILAVERTGIRVLNNEKISIDELQLVGVHDSEAINPTRLREILRQAQIDRKQPTILVAHRPVNLPVAEEEGISLQLSGHTHGGQVWPWNLLVSRIYGRFGRGLHRLGEMQVYTSNGVGSWGPPLRVGTKSEIVMLQFEAEGEPTTKHLSGE